MRPIVSIRDLRFRYRGSDRDTLRLGALDVEGPGLVAVTGPTGVGKTTLMELLAGTLHEPYEGSIRVLGVELRELRRDAERQRHLRRVGLIPQDFALLPGSSVEEILRQDLTDAQVPPAEHGARTGCALDAVEMLGFAGRKSEQLSGGQRQRVAIARTLARDVELIIADEPTANLDPRQAHSVMAVFERLGADRPVVIVTHDPAIAARCPQRILLRPLVQPLAGVVPAVARIAAETADRTRAAGIGLGLVLSVAVIASSLAVEATNAHRTTPGGEVALRPARPAIPPARRAIPTGPAAPAGRAGAGRASAPSQLATVRVPVRVPVPVQVPVVKVVQVLEPVPVPVRTPSPTPPPRPAPVSSPATPAPTAPHFLVGGVEHPECSGGTCPGDLVQESDWEPGVPSFADDDGSILGNQHGLPAGTEVDHWNGTSMQRLQVLVSTTVLNWGTPQATGPPAGTVMELGGVDQTDECTDSSCAAPYYYSYVYLGAIG